VDLDNLVTPVAQNPTAALWMKRTAALDLSHADLADPMTLNMILWYSVRGNEPMPGISRLPAVDALRIGLKEEREELARRE
jgi:hypothetical protein